MSTTIGLIGAGKAGRPIGERLLSKGHAIRVYDINPEACQALANVGAVTAESPQEATIEITIMVLPSSDEVKAKGKKSSDFLDTTLLKEIEKEGFFARLQK